MTSVGFVGLGNIGKPMALRLAASDLDTWVHDLAPEPVAELVAAGAASTTSVAELAGLVDVLCLMVRDDAQVRDVLDQALTNARPGLVVVIHSTVRPETPGELSQVAAAHDVQVLDAPVSGGPMGAAEGTLALMVGGSEDAYLAAKPALDQLGTKVVHTGGIGSGTRFKLARNMLHFISFTAATEAQRLAEAAGLDLVELGNVVRHTDAITGGPGAIMYRDSTAPIAAEDFWHGVFSHVADLGEKDLDYATVLADDLGVDVPLAKLARKRLRPGLGL